MSSPRRRLPAGCGGRRHRRGIGAAAIAALAVSMALAGCGASGSGSGGSGAAGSSPITVAATPGVADAPLYLAASQGLFAKAGLRVTIESSSSDADNLHALTSGVADVATADYADFFYVQANVDPSLSIVADGYDAAPNVLEVLALPGSGINSPQDLAGKTIGTPQPEEFPYESATPYSLDTLAAQSVLLSDGVEPTQVTWTAMASKELVGALRSHKVDAILVTEPYIFQAESQLGATEIIDALSGATANLPLSGYFTRSSFARHDPDALRTFQSVLAQAQTEAAAGKGVRSVLSHSSQMNTLTAQMVTLGVYPSTLNVDGVQDLDNLMTEFSMLAAPVNVASMVFR